MDWYFEREIFIHTQIRQVLTKNGIVPIHFQSIGTGKIELKYRVETMEEAYFVKLSRYGRFTKELVCDLEQAQAATGAVSLPCITQNVLAIHRQVNVYPWIQGEDLRAVIRKSSEGACLELGVFCGHTLRQIHRATSRPASEASVISKLADDCIQILNTQGGLLVCIKKYLSLLWDWPSALNSTRPYALVHMDYKPKNIIQSHGKQIVVDWDSCVIADPWLDFFDKGLALVPQRQAFSAGVIYGYFNGKTPPSFWPYLKTLSVLALLQSAKWAIQRKDMDYIRLLERHLWNSYRGFSCDVPIWYARINNEI